MAELESGTETETAAGARASDESRMRKAITRARRVVIKIGSKSLSGDAWDRLAAEVAAARAQKRSVVVVSSGAIALGVAKLGLKSRPKDMAWLQAAAAAGQKDELRRRARRIEQHDDRGIIDPARQCVRSEGRVRDIDRHPVAESQGTDGIPRRRAYDLVTDGVRGTDLRPSHVGDRLADGIPQGDRAGDSRSARFRCGGRSQSKIKP